MGPSPAQCDGAQFENQNNVPLPAEGGGFHRASFGLWRTGCVKVVSLHEKFNDIIYISRKEIAL